MAAPLSTEETRRYARHLILPEVGREGQARLKRSSVLVIGAGGLGSPAALYLAAAGVGRIGLIDHDVVDPTNLHRQILYDDTDVGESKVARAAARLRAANPHIEVEPHAERLTAENALSLFARYDVIVDGSDNFPTRYLANDAAVLTARPIVHGAVFRFEGQVAVFAAPDGPCYRCLYPTPPAPGTVPSCSDSGVLGVLPGIIGTIQAAEALKLLLGIGTTLAERLLLFDARDMRFTEVNVRRDPHCGLCGADATQRTLIDYDAFCGIERDDAEVVIDATLVARRIAAGEPLVLVDVREPHEVAAQAVPGARHVPMGELEARLHEIPRDAPVVFLCASGARARRAAAMLRAAGHADAHALAGGPAGAVGTEQPRNGHSR